MMTMTRQAVILAVLAMLPKLAQAGTCTVHSDPNFRCTGIRNGTNGINGTASVNWGNLYSPAMTGNPTDEKAFWAAYATDNLSPQSADYLLTINGDNGSSNFHEEVQADSSGMNGAWL